MHRLLRRRLGQGDVYDAQTPAVVGPNGESLVKQGVWATALSQGADIVNGDIYSPEDNGSGANTRVRAPRRTTTTRSRSQPGTTNGSVYIFDPVFCATNNDGSQGMGDRWFGRGGMSTFYDLWDTNNTPYDLTDDTWIAGTTGHVGMHPNDPPDASNPLYGLFRKSNRNDPSQGQGQNNGSTSCELGSTTDPTQGAYWHNRWWPLATGIAGPIDTIPRVYRIRVTTTDLAAPDGPEQRGRAEQLLDLRERGGTHLPEHADRSELPARLRARDDGGVHAAGTPPARPTCTSRRSSPPMPGRRSRSRSGTRATRATCERISRS